MAQPAQRILSADKAADVARSLETPTDIKQFLALAPESPSVRAFLQTSEWAAIYSRLMGNGKLPTGAAKSLDDVIRFLRWTSDGSLGTMPHPEAAKAYRHAAVEVEAYARRASRLAPVSPAGPGPSPEDMLGLSFSEALSAVRAGRHITRSNWAAGTYVAAQAGYPHGIGINVNTARATGLPEGTTAAFRPYLMRLLPSALAGEPPAFMPWTPDQDDLFAEDWTVLPR
jgi:hypothetical protein